MSETKIQPMDGMKRATDFIAMVAAENRGEITGKLLAERLAVINSTGQKNNYLREDLAAIRDGVAASKDDKGVLASIRDNLPNSRRDGFGTELFGKMSSLVSNMSAMDKLRATVNLPGLATQMAQIGVGDFTRRVMARVDEVKEGIKDGVSSTVAAVAPAASAATVAAATALTSVSAAASAVAPTVTEGASDLSRIFPPVPGAVAGATAVVVTATGVAGGTAPTAPAAGDKKVDAGNTGRDALRASEASITLAEAPITATSVASTVSTENKGNFSPRFNKNTYAGAKAFLERNGIKNAPVLDGIIKGRKDDVQVSQAPPAQPGLDLDY